MAAQKREGTKDDHDSFVLILLAARLQRAVEWIGKTFLHCRSCLFSLYGCQGRYFSFFLAGAPEMGEPIAP